VTNLQKNKQEYEKNTVSVEDVYTCLDNRTSINLPLPKQTRIEKHKTFDRKHLTTIANSKLKVDKEYSLCNAFFG
jgi:hypothetical protein